LILFLATGIARDLRILVVMPDFVLHFEQNQSFHFVLVTGSE
jgi:hypothetical protein